MINIYDGREAFYQWDTNQKIVSNSFKVGEEVHFFNGYYHSSALITLTYEYNGKVVADVPNILLQKSAPIIVYRVVVDNEGRSTRKEYCFNVKQRAKPDDYVYTETEVMSYKQLDERLSELEGDGLANAVADYLEQNPPEGGASAEQLAQIEKNAEDIEKLNTDKLSASELDEAIESALTQAKESGEFDGADGKNGSDGKDGYTPVKGVDYFDGKDGEKGDPGKDGTPGADGKDGITPHIGDNGNWFIGDTDTGVSAIGGGGSTGGGASETLIADISIAEDVTQYDLPITEDIFAVLKKAREIICECNFKLPSADNGTTFGAVSIGLAKNWGMAATFVKDVKCLPYNGASYAGESWLASHTLFPKTQTAMVTYYGTSVKNAGNAGVTGLNAPQFAPSTLMVGDMFRVAGGHNIGAGSTIKIYARE